MPSNNEQSICIRIPRDTHQALRLHGVARGQTMAEVITLALAAYLAPESPAEPPRAQK